MSIFVAVSYAGFQRIVYPSSMSIVDEGKLMGSVERKKKERKMMCVGACGLGTQCDESQLNTRITIRNIG